MTTVVSKSSYINSLSTKEDKYIVLFLNKLAKEAQRLNDPIYKQLYTSLVSLYHRGCFKLHFMDRNAEKDNLMRYTYGYYSAYENAIYLVVDKNNFETKWLGLATDYDNFTEKSIKSFVVTCVHELMHYCCNNYNESFVKIWRQTIYTHIWNTFKNLIDSSFYDFVDPISAHNISAEQFFNDPNYKKAFDTYFNSIMINIKFRLHSLTKRYNDILSTLYSKHPFLFARFFDNVLVCGIKLHEGIFTSVTMKIYYALQKAYYDVNPQFRNIKMYSLFYQEMFDFSEIACIFATYAKYAPKQQHLVIKTLELINVV